MKKVFFIFVMMLLVTLMLGLSSCSKCKHDNIQSIVTAPTCTENGYTAFICEDCGYGYFGDITEAQGHTSSDWISYTTQTCVTEGTNRKECTKCKVVLEEESIPATDHNYVSAFVPPTATDNGYTEYSCTKCSDTYKDSYITPTDFKVTSVNRVRIGYTGEESENLVIPAVFEYKGTWYRVTLIGDYAFSGCDNLASVVIPESVTAIDKHAFQYCTNITSVVIGNNVNSIGFSAFYSLKSLKSVTIPESVTFIDEAAFLECTSLTSITVDENNSNYKSIDGNLYAKDGKMLIQYALGKTETNFEIPDGVTSIGYAAFGGDTPLYNLKSIVIPNSVTRISDFAFYNCCSLTSIVIPNSVTEIGYAAFAYCSSLNSVVIPDSLTSIGDYVFAYCSSLNSVVIPNSVTEIGYAAFADCPSLSSVVISDGVTMIDDYAFADCINLTNIVMPDSLTAIGDYVFAGCSSLKSIAIPDGVKSIGNSAFVGCSSLTSIVIPNSVTAIGSEAFYECTALTTVVISDNLTSIGRLAFCGCSSLTSITVDVNNPNYKSIDGNLYSKDGKTLIQYAIGKTATSFTLPNSVTTIGESAFSCCESLISIIIPNSVTSIGGWAFSDCISLTSIKYLGTEAEWSAIYKGDEWDFGTCFAIICNYIGE